MKRFQHAHKPLLIGFTMSILALTSCLFFPAPLRGEESGRPLIKAHFELGYLAVLSHRIQFGKDGTNFSYVRSGGQDNLYAVSRMSLDLRLSRRNTLIFLFQPLALETRTLLAEPLRVDGLDFPAGTPMRFVYKFPFYRVSYLHDFSKNPKTELALGFSLQIRNATIEFESLDGSLFRSNRNIGPVPILRSAGATITTPAGGWEPRRMVSTPRSATSTAAKTRSSAPSWTRAFGPGFS